MLSTRRAVVATFLSAPALPLASRNLAEAQSAVPRLEPTPSCSDGQALTLARGEGPYFTPNAPLRHDLAMDVPKVKRITIAGFVLDTRCQPVREAIVQIWHADENGRYDTSGYKFRGYEYTDDSGRWWFSTIEPAFYPGRTRHYHVKVQGPSGRLLTTQLFFPGEPLNARDGLFNEQLLLRISDVADGKFGRFDFVV
jgi:protocatechuate 3,4-dioxygenase beta subunit